MFCKRCIFQNYYSIFENSHYEKKTPCIERKDVMIVSSNNCHWSIAVVPSD